MLRKAAREELGRLLTRRGEDGEVSEPAGAGRSRRSSIRIDGNARCASDDAGEAQDDDDDDDETDDVEDVAHARKILQLRGPFVGRTLAGRQATPRKLRTAITTTTSPMMTRMLRDMDISRKAVGWPTIIEARPDPSIPQGR